MIELKNLKVGNMVILRNRCKFSLEVIKRITKTQIVINEKYNEKYNKETGNEVGTYNYSYKKRYILPINEENIKIFIEFSNDTIKSLNNTIKEFKEKIEDLQNDIYIEQKEQKHLIDYFGGLK